MLLPDVQSYFIIPVSDTRVHARGNVQVHDSPDEAPIKREQVEVIECEIENRAKDILIIIHDIHKIQVT